MPTIEKIFPEYIHLDGGTQPRARISQEVCDDYAEQMRAGQPFPRIDVYFDGENYWLADGFHRHQACMLARPGEAMECNLYQGTQQDAQWHSYGVNKTHGLRRTNGDKARAVQAALSHKRSKGMSDAAVAEHVGVRRETVLKYRHEMQSQFLETNKSTQHTEATDMLETNNSALRTGRDGRTINTSNIGKRSAKSKRGNKRTSRRPRSAGEYLAAKREGRRVRQPPSIVKVELPNNHVHNFAYELLEYFKFEYLQKVYQEVVQIHQERSEKEIS